MKKMFGIVVVLLFIYVIFQLIYSYTVGRHINSYKIREADEEYQIKEIYTSRHRTPNRSDLDRNNYYYEIGYNDKVLFSFKLIGDFTGVEQYLTKLKVYTKNNVTCIYPIFKDKINSQDVICNDNGKQYLYNTVKGKDLGLDTFVSYMISLGYYHASWDIPSTETKNVGSVMLYPKNIGDDETFSIWQSNGFYRITNKGENYFPIETSEAQESTLTAMVNQYFVLPDYKGKDKFGRIYVVNLITGSMETMNLGEIMSYNAFVQGVVDNKIYLIDRDNKIQYAIDIYNKETKIVGNASNNAKYFNGKKWSKKPIQEVIDSNLIFKTETIIPDNLTTYKPLYVGEYGGDTDGYYYLYVSEPSSGNINVYRVDKQNTNMLTLIFQVPSINDIKYEFDSIYFVSEKTLYSYRNDFGLRPIINYNEFTSNKNGLYNVHVNE